MFKKTAVVFLTLLFFLFGGCFSYKGLDRLTIVTGIALDYDEESQKYLATLEIVDISHSSNEGIKDKILECEGISVTDAFFNATRKIKNHLYFGSCEVLIVCPKIAQKGLKMLMDTFMRTKELRETAFLIVSQEEKAADLFKKAKGLTSTIISIDIQQLIDQGNKHSGTIKKVKMYQFYIDLMSEEKCLSLPALHLVDNDEDKVVEANGTAVFKHDKLRHYLTPEETIYFLMAIDDYRGGVLTLDVDGKPESDFCILVGDAVSDTTYKKEGEEPAFSIDIRIKASLTESEHFEKMLKFDELKKLEEKFAKRIEENVKKLFDKLQKDYNCDIAGLGHIIHKKDNKFWEKIKPDWFEIYARAKVDVKASVKIENINITR